MGSIASEYKHIPGILEQYHQTWKGSPQHLEKNHGSWGEKKKSVPGPPGGADNVAALGEQHVHCDICILDHSTITQSGRGFAVVHPSSDLRSRLASEPLHFGRLTLVVVEISAITISIRSYCRKHFFFLAFFPSPHAIMFFFDPTTQPLTYSSRYYRAGKMLFTEAGCSVVER